MKGIDFKLLKNQKKRLVNLRASLSNKDGEHYKALSGIIHLIDALQNENKLNKTSK